MPTIADCKNFNDASTCLDRCTLSQVRVDSNTYHPPPYISFALHVTFTNQIPPTKNGKWYYCPCKWLTYLHSQFFAVLYTVFEALWWLVLRLTVEPVEGLVSGIFCIVNPFLPLQMQTNSWCVELTHAFCSWPTHVARSSTVQSHCTLTSPTKRPPHVLLRHIWKT